MVIHYGYQVEEDSDVNDFIISQIQFNTYYTYLKIT